MHTIRDRRPRRYFSHLAQLASLGFGPWDFFGYTNTVNRLAETIAAKVDYIIVHGIAIHFDDVAEPIHVGLRERGHHEVLGEMGKKPLAMYIRTIAGTSRGCGHSY
ncbi:MAG: hypothetical protein OWR62_16420 [Sulfobacillus thermotolerans]|nr:hypothetical protein [Sulfobacillus thermotolerans]